MNIAANTKMAATMASPQVTGVPMGRRWAKKTMTPTQSINARNAVTRATIRLTSFPATGFLCDQLALRLASSTFGLRSRTGATCLLQAPGAEVGDGRLV